MTSIQKYTPNTEEFTFQSLRDDYERRTWHYDHAQTILGVSNSRLLNWIGSIDHSGYTREKCLLSIITNYEHGDENRILLRLSDWVPQVQTLARTWVLTHFHDLSSDAIKGNQRLILYLSRKDRLKEDEGWSKIKCNLLARTKTMTPTEFFDFTPMFRRFIFCLSIVEDQHPRQWILDDPEPFNRLLLLNKLKFTSITSDEKQRLEDDKSIFIRRQIFRSQLESGETPDKNKLITLALDSNQSLRRLGQFHLKNNFNIDAHEIYQNLQGEQFFYIADYAYHQDVEHLLEGVHSGSKSTQFNCLRALVSTTPERLKDLEIASLITQNRKFRSLLTPLLHRLLTIEEILALRLVFEGSSPHGIISFFQILKKKSFWNFVNEGLLVLLSDPEPLLRETIICAIQSKSSINEPLSKQLNDSISNKIAQLRDHDPKLNEHVLTLLEFIIKTA